MALLSLVVLVNRAYLSLQNIFLITEQEIIDVDWLGMRGVVNRNGILVTFLLAVYVMQRIIE